MEAANAEPVMLQGQLVQCKGVANQVKCLLVYLCSMHNWRWLLYMIP